MAYTASELLLLFSSLSYSSDVLALLPGIENGCEENGTRMCCSGYYELNESCHECIGSFGENCTSPCPEDWFGPRCKEHCSCPDSECDDAFGCLKDPLRLENPTSSSSPERSTISIYTDTSKGTPVLSDVSTTPDLWEMFLNEIQSLNVGNWIIISIIFVAFVQLIVLCIVIVKCRKKRKRNSTRNEHGLYMNQLFQQQTDSDEYSSVCEYNSLNETMIGNTDSKPTETEYMEIF